jgi:hypothetical protein
VRHRRLQALSLVALAALLTTSVCLGPLYQRAMEQALAGSVLANATPQQKALRLDSVDRSASELERFLPNRLARSFTDPVVSRTADVRVQAPTGSSTIATRLYAVDGACERLEIVSGSCPAEPGQVMVSTADVEVNGWSLGSQVDFTERLDPAQFPEPGAGVVTVVGVYEPPTDEEWLSAPITGRAGFDIPDVGVATDDWVTSQDTMTTSPPTDWQRLSTSVVWSVDPDAVDHDALLELGQGVQEQVLDPIDITVGGGVRAATDLPGMADRVAEGSEQGRTTVVVLVAQLLILVAVVLWMVLVAATDDRRPELALARLRGRGRRGAAAYLLTELIPLTLCGVALGVLASPFVMALVAKAAFPVPVPIEVPGGFVLAVLGAALAVLAVVLAAARRAVREPVDSMLRAIPARHTGRASGIVEIAITVFSLTAVVVLLTGNLEGPLAILAPTLLAVAVGLLLGRGLAPATRYLSRQLLRGGHAVAAAGIVTAVRRPAASRVLVMVVVASSLLVFCVNALVVGQHNRQRAAEQDNGAPYALSVQPTRLTDLVAAVAAADPDHRHLTPVVTTTNNGTTTAPTIAVDSTAFPRVAYFPLSQPRAADWDRIHPPRVDPLPLTGETLAGTVASDDLRLTGPSAARVEELRISLQVLRADGLTMTSELSVIPTKDGTTTFSAPVQCASGCTVTGIAVTAPVGGKLDGTVVLRDLTLDGQPFSLGQPTGWRKVSNRGGDVVPVSDAAGSLGVQVTTDGSTPPVMVSAWVPDPVPALVSTDEPDVFPAPWLLGQIDMTVAGSLERVPGSPPGSRVVDLEGLLRRAQGSSANLIIQVWSDDAGALDRATTELKKRGITPGGVTSVDDVRADLDASPAAWSLSLSVLVGLAALLVAALVIIVATATTWRGRATDLAALRMAGLPSRSLRRLELLGQLPVVLVGSLVGAICGVLAAVVALPGVRQFTEPPAVDTTDFSTPWPAVLVAAVVTVLLLSALTLASSRWTARRASLSRLREVV